jgi:hypothetical protein
MRIAPWTLLAAATVMMNAACTIDSAEDASGAREAFAQAPAPAPTLVTITASDYAFAAPATVPAGLTTVRLVNQGKEMHHAQLVRLDEGHTVQELMQAGGGPVPEWAHFVGGPNVPAPNGFTEATMQLQAGNYALLCFIPSPDGVPHLMKGMVKALTVVESADAPQAQPAVADVRMVLRDYAFDITPEIAAGRHVIQVENAAAQPHEVVVMRLAPGKTPQDVLAWEHERVGPPPATIVAGTSMLSTGETNQIAGDFTPGEYALLCFVPDARDGKPHIAHGMVRQLTVR